MQIIRVIPGADRAQLEETARHCGMRVGIQGGMQVLIADSSQTGAYLNWCAQKNSNHQQQK